MSNDAPAPKCAKCGCPQSKHHSTKQRLTLADRPDIESYCSECGAEDCWHFTDYKPPAPSERCPDHPDLESCVALDHTPAPAPTPSERCANCGRPEGDAIHDEEYERGGHDFVAPIVAWITDPHAPAPSERKKRPTKKRARHGIPATGYCANCGRYVLTAYKLWCGIRCQNEWDKKRRQP
jgi:hypothetical protein